MNATGNKPFYKVISLFIKSVILFLSFFFIWTKLAKASMSVDFSLLFSSANIFYVILVFFLMFVNWSLEAVKWQLLIAPLEQIPFLTSLRSVFAGVTVSIFTPNRIGEFAGRVFSLQKADKIKATMISLIGSAMQLFVTIAFGIAAYFILQKSNGDYFQTERFVSANALLVLIGAFVLLIVTFLIIVFNEGAFPRFMKYTDTLKMYSLKKLNLLFYLSMTRYVVFSVQYYIVLHLFGIHGEPLVLFSLIALTFLVTSAIPTFALTEIAVRAGVATYFFETVSESYSSIIGASLFLWIVNLALPALAGSFFVWKLKFFNN